MSDEQKLEIILRHIHLVESNMQRLARTMMKDRKEFALELLQRSRTHDLSKLSPFEFDHLHEGALRFDEALQMHREGNSHHPEHRTSIHNMPEADVVEMVCDWFARAQEFGTDLRKWVWTVATERYDFERSDEIAKTIEKYLNMVLLKPFS
jgi:hypothetical protein